MFCHTVLMEARDALWLTFEPTTEMTTGMNFVTTLVHQVNAFFFPADIPEGRLLAGSWLSLDLFLAEAALTRILEFQEFLTGLAQVVGILFAGGTEVCLAFVASYSVLTHMQGSLSKDQIRLDNISTYLEMGFPLSSFWLKSGFPGTNSITFPHLHFTTFPLWSKILCSTMDCKFSHSC